MSTIATASGDKPRKLLPAGSHVARCVWVIDLGTQETNWQGVKDFKHQITLGFEVCEERIEIDGKDLPMFISSTYTLSLYKESKLAKHLSSWRGQPFTDEEAKAFQVANLLGVPCMLSIEHTEKDGKTYANVSTITKLHHKLEALPQENPSLHYEIEMGQNEVFELLPKWLKAKVMQSLEQRPFGDGEHAETAVQSAPAQQHEEEAPLPDEPPF